MALLPFTPGPLTRPRAGAGSGYRFDAPSATTSPRRGRGGPLPPSALAVLGSWTFAVAVLVMGALEGVPAAMALGAGLVLISAALVCRYRPSTAYGSAVSPPRATPTARSASASTRAWTPPVEPVEPVDHEAVYRRRRLVERLERMAAGSPYAEERDAFARKLDELKRRPSC